MTLSHRVVFDTSTLIGALLRPGSTPRRALNIALADCDLCVSQAGLDELEAVLRRKKFDRYLPLAQRLEFLALYLAHTTLHAVDTADLQRATGACRDAKDDKFLALLLSCGATALVASDDDLLVLHPWQGMAVLTPAAFVATASTWGA